MRPGERTDLSDSDRSQGERAARKGVSRDTQWKLDALARKAPALLARVQGGEAAAPGLIPSIFSRNSHPIGRTEWCRAEMLAARQAHPCALARPALLTRVNSVARSKH
jgi:hypothetical protein